jgi:ABC-type uncharacterized transport system substrate-binding protein
MRLALALLLAPAPALAHPHVFVDSRIELVMEGTALVAVRLSWTYDEFFSLMLTQELGLDPDADGVLTEAEAAALAASVADWPPDFGGDLAVTANGAPVALAPRADHTVATDGTRIVETHTRPLAAPLDATAGVTVENFDPYYYVAYAILPDVAVTGGACSATVVPADVVMGQAKVDELYGALDVAGAGAEVQLPPVGFAFADRVELRCAP